VSFRLNAVEGRDNRGGDRVDKDDADGPAATNFHAIGEPVAAVLDGQNAQVGFAVNPRIGGRSLDRNFVRAFCRDVRVYRDVDPFVQPSGDADHRPAVHLPDRLATKNRQSR
jgi:hypothetical protein